MRRSDIEEYIENSKYGIFIISLEGEGRKFFSNIEKCAISKHYLNPIDVKELRDICLFVYKDLIGEMFYMIESPITDYLKHINSGINTDRYRDIEFMNDPIILNNLSQAYTTFGFMLRNIINKFIDVEDQSSDLLIDSVSLSDIVIERIRK